uniref:Uncharacterized protein n=1 Tax=Heterorhabditis bacteriophora TaxID=37862 RepID=A0A1I7X628_HETBA
MESSKNTTEISVSGGNFSQRLSDIGYGQQGKGNVHYGRMELNRLNQFPKQHL